MKARAPICTALVFVLGASPPWVCARQPPEAMSTDVAAARDLFLAEFGLTDALAAGLRQRLAGATGETRTVLAEQLSRLYAKMLSDASSSRRRQDIEERCRDLARIAPEANSYALRLTLAAAQYLPIEEVVEQRAMRMTTREDDVEAERVLRSVRPVFAELAVKLNQSVKTLRDRKDRGVNDDAEAERLRLELEEANSLRSRAFYYSAWCNYYTALFTGDTKAAKEAMESFGAILNAVPGRPATLERLAEANLKYEHIAKAVMGCALASAILGNHVEAERWLDALSKAEDVPAPVLAQFLRRQITVFAAGGRWADIRAAVNRARQPDGGKIETPLATPDARILSVLALTALSRDTLTPSHRAAAEEMAEIGLGDLITRGEVGHVLSLVNTFGTAPIGRDGFINNYVRGLRAYDDAREAHKAGAQNIEIPSAESEVILAYRASADLFGSSAAAPDAGRFPVERSRALICRGLSLYYAGDLDQAADAFERAHAEGATEEQKRDALWYAIVTLDRAAASRPSVAARRRALATLFIKTFPLSERAVELLLQQHRAGGVIDRRELETLLQVTPDSPLYLTSRRVAARLLYREFQRATTDNKEHAILRFAEVVEALLRIETSRATSARDGQSREIAEDALIHARQLTDALLSSRTPDVARAEAALAAMDGVAAYHGIDLRQHEAELSFNSLRIAWARGDDAAAQRALSKLRETGGVYASAAERALYRSALAAWTESPQDTGAAARVVAAGSRVLLDPAANADAAAGVRDRVAEAAFMIWMSGGDAAMRDVAVRTDRAQVDAGRRTAASLRRLAVCLEAMDQATEALALWSELLSGLEETDPGWFEARHESIRLMAKSDTAKASLSLRQHKLLHPSWGPSPWDVKFAELERLIGPPATQPSGTPTPAGSGGR